MLIPPSARMPLTVAQHEFVSYQAPSGKRDKYRMYDPRSPGAVESLSFTENCDLQYLTAPYFIAGPILDLESQMGRPRLRIKEAAPP
jgi:hypothetical protein